MASTSNNAVVSVDAVDSQNDIKLQDLNLKMKIASNIIDCCITDAYDGVEFTDDDVNEKVKKYTKADNYLIYKAVQKKKHEKPFSQAQIEKTAETCGSSPYEMIRNIYVDYYLNNKLIPSREALWRSTVNTSTRTRLKTRIDILKRSGFTWLPIPGTNKGITIENPAHMRKRCEYLSKISKYRKEGKNIIYIEERLITTGTIHPESYYISKTNYDVNPTYLILVGNKNGVLENCFYDFDEKHLIHFIINSIIPKVSTPTVFVLGEKNHHDKKRPVPADYSSRNEMLEFLTLNDIPHNPKMHRAELYTLIQKNKKVCKTLSSSYEKQLSVYGHELLRRPWDLSNLNFFEPFFKSIAEELLKNTMINNTRSKFVKLTNEYRVEDWEKLEELLIENEKKIYTEDMMIEEIIDRIIIAARTGNISLTESVVNIRDKKFEDDDWSDFVIPLC